MRTLLTTIAVLGLMSNARAANIEVFVPYECQSVAQEFGVPYILRSKAQITYALYKLNRLNRSQPGVSECRAAVERMKAAYRAQKNKGEAGARSLASEKSDAENR